MAAAVPSAVPTSMSAAVAAMDWGVLVVATCVAAKDSA